MLLSFYPRFVGAPSVSPSVSAAINCPINCPGKNCKNCDRALAAPFLTFARWLDPRIYWIKIFKNTCFYVDQPESVGQFVRAECARLCRGFLVRSRLFDRSRLLQKNTEILKFWNCILFCFSLFTFQFTSLLSFQTIIGVDWEPVQASPLIKPLVCLTEAASWEMHKLQMYCIQSNIIFNYIYLIF